MSNLFGNKPSCKVIELSIGDVCLHPLMVKHAKMFESITNDNGNAAEQHTMLAMLLKELVTDTDGNKFEDLNKMSADDIKEHLTMQDFATLIQAMAPTIGAQADPNLV